MTSPSDGRVTGAAADLEGFDFLRITTASHVDLGPFEVQPQGPLPCEGDTDGDLTIGLSDLLTVLSEWGSCVSSTGCAGDIDGDGFIGLSDLLAVLAGWGDCP